MDEPKRPAREPRTRKRPRKISPRYLENSALHYLKRYSATVAGVKRVMLRKVDRSLKEHGGDRNEAIGWLDALLEKLVRGGLVNDQAYAQTRANSLRNSGRSSRMIAQKLRLKGVTQEMVVREVSAVTQDVTEDDAAKIWARKKRLGPFRRDPSTRKDNRQRDLASLARAGFPFSVAKKIIDGSAE